MEQALLTILGAVLVAAVGGGGWLVTRRGSAVAAASDVVELVSHELTKMSARVTTAEALNETLTAENEKMRAELTWAFAQIEYLKSAIGRIVESEEQVAEILEEAARLPHLTPPFHQVETPPTVTRSGVGNLTPQWVIAISAAVASATIIATSIAVLVSI